MASPTTSRTLSKDGDRKCAIQRGRSVVVTTIMMSCVIEAEVHATGRVEDLPGILAGKCSAHSQSCLWTQ